MEICKEFIIKDILDYEILNDINILEELEQCNLSVMIDLVRIGNNCSEENAEEIVSKGIEELGIEKFTEELAYEIIGTRPDERKGSTNSKDFKSFSEVLENFYSDIQVIDKNLGLSDFWNISTRYMYRYADGLQKRFVNETNSKWRDLYMDKVMLGQMLAGKLKDCPQLNEDGTLHKESEVDKIKAFFAGRSNSNG